jgi:succinate-semialdehyde dehydrogenase/glutarate-semialdehyde dehydrogenase
MMESTNPATGRTLETYDELDDAGLEARLEAADRTFREWRSVAFDERARFMTRAAGVLDDGRRELARLMTREMGKPIAAAVAEAEKCASVCRYYAVNAERFLADEVVETSASRSWITFQPLGPVLAVMPWNFPFWQVFRFAAPALMAGNVGLLKHASNVPGCALAIEDVFRRAGFPDGAFQTLLIGSDRIEDLIADSRIRAVTLTGSEPAGAAVAAAAGKRIKKSVLELGGSDPFIVMPSADIDRAVETAVKARTINNGQSCIAAKRFIVHESIAEGFERAFVDRMSALRMGDPMEEDSDIGPLATASIRDDLHAQVRASIDAGARLLLGGSPASGDGWFYPPTVLSDIPDGCPAADDELFGPVASIFRVRDLDSAIERANATPFGLGAAAWTANPDEQSRFIRDVDAGCIFINGMVASDPRLPFGGVRRSGFGRELSRYGILEFVNIKTVWVG